MNKIKKIILTLSIIFFSACGTETEVDSSLPFNMWDYMTSSSNYEVEYDVYENNLKVDFYSENHRQFGTHYERESANGLTRLTRNNNTIVMNEPNNTTLIQMFAHLGNQDIFQSSSIQLCTLERFYDRFHNKEEVFYNVLQVNCTSLSGIYQKFYYAYNEGIVSIYEKNNGFITEYVKVNEREIL